jgi:hypothetical protein
MSYSGRGGGHDAPANISVPDRVVVVPEFPLSVFVAVSGHGASARPLDGDGPTRPLDSTHGRVLAALEEMGPISR